MSARRSRRPPPRGRGAGRALAIAAAAAVVLGATFAAGALGGRWWSQHGEKSTALLAGVRAHAEARAAEVAVAPSTSSWKAWLGIAPRKSAPEVSPRGDRTAKTPPAAPMLTFYQELTAPLTAPAPAPKPPAPSASAPVSSGPAAAPPAPLVPVPRRDRPVDVRREASTDAGGEAAPEARREAATGEPNGPRFTIQVGAYRARETADAVRARLEGSGQEIYITESAGPEGVRYRVRVGSFVTHDAARAAAARLAAERHVPTYVTTR